MSKNRSGFVGTLVTVGALGAMAGMLAWRFSQRHRTQRQSFYRDLSRWEGEGGSLADTTGQDLDPETSVAAGAHRNGMKGALAGGGGSDVSSSGNGAAGLPWPFPHS
ncbi:MAG: hypothetical protein JO239_11760 [Paraburkholderia sp.]|nr:hypothetical protein [Paraburkholderia sp.]